MMPRVAPFDPTTVIPVESLEVSRPVTVRKPFWSVPCCVWMVVPRPVNVNGQVPVDAAGCERVNCVGESIDTIDAPERVIVMPVVR